MKPMTESALWEKLVEDKHLLMTDAIKSLKHRRDVSLSAQEEHCNTILNLKQSLANLKSEKEALEKKIEDDERVCSLEKERDFYRKESIRLNAEVESLKSKLGKK